MRVYNSAACPVTNCSTFNDKIYLVYLRIFIHLLTQMLACTLSTLPLASTFTFARTEGVVDKAGIQVKELLAELTGKAKPLSSVVQKDGWMVGCLDERACLGDPGQ